jgi:hypothetical protein
MPPTTPRLQIRADEPDRNCNQDWPNNHRHPLRPRAHVGKMQSGDHSSDANQIIDTLNCFCHVCRAHNCGKLPGRPNFFNDRRAAAKKKQHTSFNYPPVVPRSSLLTKAEESGLQLYAIRPGRGAADCAECRETNGAVPALTPPATQSPRPRTHRCILRPPKFRNVLMVALVDRQRPTAKTATCGNARAAELY